MDNADRQRMLIVMSAVLDMIEATPGTELPDGDFLAAVDRLTAATRSHGDVVAAMYFMARLTAYSMGRRAQIEGISFADAMMAARIEAMGGPGAE